MVLGIIGGGSNGDGLLGGIGDLLGIEDLLDGLLGGLGDLLGLGDLIDNLLGGALGGLFGDDSLLGGLLGEDSLLGGLLDLEILNVLLDEDDGLLSNLLGGLLDGNEGLLDVLELDGLLSDDGLLGLLDLDDGLLGILDLGLESEYGGVLGAILGPVSGLTGGALDGLVGSILDQQGNPGAVRDIVTGVIGDDDDNLVDSVLDLLLGQDNVEQPVWAENDNDVRVVAATYQFFTDSIPEAEGFEYLISSPDNATDLNDAYYAQFNQENRMLNFANNLGTQGEGMQMFVDNYQGLSYESVITKAYLEIVGTSASNPALDFFMSDTARDFYEEVAMARVVPTGVALEDAISIVAIGSILHEATKEGSGFGNYHDAIEDLLVDIQEHGDQSPMLGNDMLA